MNIVFTSTARMLWHAYVHNIIIIMHIIYVGVMVQ